MKIFISADIEGVTGCTSWSEATPGDKDYAAFARQMTKEVAAACQGAIEAGADEIVIKDAHDTARNIDFTQLPRNVKLVRGWMGTPYSMVEGLDGTFDAALFVGYHSGADYDGNPLSHTMNTANNHVMINGVRASEFLINVYSAASLAVPVTFVSGDKMLCETVRELNADIGTVAVKEGIGGATININPDYACELIQREVRESIDRRALCRLDLPDKFEMIVNYKEHQSAKRASYYPGAKKIGPRSVQYTANSVEELITAIMFIL